MIEEFRGIGHVLYSTENIDKILFVFTNKLLSKAFSSEDFVYYTFCFFKEASIKHPFRAYPVRHYYFLCADAARKVGIDLNVICEAPFRLDSSTFLNTGLKKPLIEILKQFRKELLEYAKKKNNLPKNKSF